MQTAALAQKNSEVTRALTIQEDILEKELGEVQKVLLAMQVGLMFFGFYFIFKSLFFTCFHLCNLHCM